MPIRDEPRLSSLKSVRDDDLLRRLSDLAKQSRGADADVVAHVSEVERRQLYARQACSSMFEYCRRILRLRENEAYLRITVARASRKYPVVLEMLRDGRLHLSGIARLAPHLTRANVAAVLERACGMSHREIRELVAELEPRPDVAPTIRKLPDRRAPGHSTPQLGAPRVESEAAIPALGLRAPSHPVVLEPLAPGRYQVRFAISEKLQRVEARRFGRTKAPRSDRPKTDPRPSSRHIPAAVRRLVHARDGGRCAYRDEDGLRCARRHDLEFHHKHPFGHGGDHSPANLTLMCRAHNTLPAEHDYGEDVMARFRAAASRHRVPVDAYGERIVVQPRRLLSG